MQNVGKTEKIIRIILGLLLLVLLFVLDGNAKYVGLLGVVPLFTGLANYCPLYKLFKINTIKNE